MGGAPGPGQGQAQQAWATAARALVEHEAGALVELRRQVGDQVGAVGDEHELAAPADALEYLHTHRKLVPTWPKVTAVLDELGELDGFGADIDAEVALRAGAMDRPVGR